MITITRAQARQLRLIICRALGITRRRCTGVGVDFSAGPGGLAIQAASLEAAVQFHQPGDFTPEGFTIALEELREVEGGRSTDELTFERDGDEVIVRWTEKNAPQSTRFSANTSPRPFPDLPTEWRTNEAKLLTSLANAEEVADPNSARYALGCVQLRGADGQVAAADGRQILIESGFDFPWDDGRLMNVSKVWASKELAASTNVEIGTTKDWIAVRAGEWTILGAIGWDKRFPRVNDVIPKTEHTQATASFSDSDAKFLAESFDSLPGERDFHSPVTIDLNGSVAIRSRAQGEETARELVLSQSTRTGQEMRVSTNRHYLERAVRLGFRTLEMTEAGSPICCRDSNRAYLWAVLGKDGAIKPDEHTQRITSPAGKSKPAAGKTKPETNSTMTTNRINGHTQPEANNGKQSSEPNGQSTSPMAQAQALRETLSEALTQTRGLIAALKRQKKKSKMVESTLASLRQLEDVAS